MVAQLYYGKMAQEPLTEQGLDILHEMATLLNTGLDKETLAICMRMISDGINPEALANVIKELKRDSNNR